MLILMFQLVCSFRIVRKLICFKCKLLNVGGNYRLNVYITITAVNIVSKHYMRIHGQEVA